MHVILDHSFQTFSLTKVKAVKVHSHTVCVHLSARSMHLAVISCYLEKRPSQLNKWPVTCRRDQSTRKKIAQQDNFFNSQGYWYARHVCLLLVWFMWEHYTAMVRTIGVPTTTGHSRQIQTYNVQNQVYMHSYHWICMHPVCERKQI